MNDALRAVVKAQKGTTPFCVRYIEFINAGLDKEVQDAVMFNIIAWQQAKGELKTTRIFKHYEGQKMAPQVFESNEAAIMQNKSDAIVLEKLATYKAENSLDMSEAEAQWFDYVTEGVELDRAEVR